MNFRILLKRKFIKFPHKNFCQNINEKEIVLEVLNKNISAKKAMIKMSSWQVYLNNFSSKENYLVFNI